MTERVFSFPDRRKSKYSNTIVKRVDRVTGYQFNIKREAWCIKLLLLPKYQKHNLCQYKFVHVRTVCLESKKEERWRRRHI